MPLHCRISQLKEVENGEHRPTEHMKSVKEAKETIVLVTKMPPPNYNQL